jgi:hypothetical protein
VASQLASDIALVAPVVTDDRGTALLDVQVKVDGEPLTTRLDGRPLAVDPGVREFSFIARVGSWPGREIATTRTITIEQGQRGAIAVELPPIDVSQDAATPSNAGAEGAPHPVPQLQEPREARRGGASAFAYLLGGVGLLGVGAGGLLTYWGKTDNSALAACSPNCHPSSVDHIRKLYFASDVSFAAGGAAIGLSALLFATSHVSVQPVRSGAFASLKGTF